MDVNATKDTPVLPDWPARVQKVGRGLFVGTALLGKKKPRTLMPPGGSIYLSRGGSI